MKPSQVQVGLDLKVVSITGTWEPNDAERRAAWELYVELITRVSVVPLPPTEGLLREALDSLYALFPITREVLRRAGPDAAERKSDGQYNLAYLAVAILNLVIRPTLARWHPELEDWESRRDPGVSRPQHERDWPQAARLRSELETTRSYLARFAALLATVNDIPDLSDAVPVRGATDPSAR